MLWAVARDGIADPVLETAQAALRGEVPRTVLPLLDTIVERVPPPRVQSEGPLQLRVTQLEHDDYVGRIVIGRIERGEAREGMPVSICRSDDPAVRQGKVSQLYTFAKLRR